MTHRDVQPGLVGEILQLPLPEPQSPPIAATAIGGDQDLFRGRIDPTSFRPPPAANGGYSKRSGIMIGSDIDEAHVASDVVDAVGISSGHTGTRKVMALNMGGVLDRQPLLTLVFVLADELFLLGIDRNDRKALSQIELYLDADVLKLRIAIGMIGTFFSLAIALQSCNPNREVSASPSCGSPDALACPAPRQSPAYFCISSAEAIPDTPRV